VFFVPNQKRQYKITVPIEAVEDYIVHNNELGYHNPGSAYSEAPSSKQFTTKFSIEVYGEGSDGSINISQEEIDFKAVKIGEQKKLNIVLKNSSNCAFFVDLTFKNNRFEDNYTPPSEAQVLSVFNLDFREGILPANSERTIGVFFSPIEV
jgi:hypothetical protein